MKHLVMAAIIVAAISAALGAADELGYSPDGGLVSFGEFDYVYVRFMCCAAPLAADLAPLLSPGHALFPLEIQRLYYQLEVS